MAKILKQKGSKLYMLPCNFKAPHRIVVSRKGSIVTLDHDIRVLNSEIMMSKMSGSKMPACAIALCRLRGWMMPGRAVFPPRLRALFAAAMEKRNARALKKKGNMKLDEFIVICNQQMTTEVDADDWEAFKATKRIGSKILKGSE